MESPWRFHFFIDFVICIYMNTQKPWSGEMKVFILIMLVSMLVLSGCASTGYNSTYTNLSRDGYNEIRATGQAAANAAWVHTSNASLGGANSSSSGRYGSYGQREQQSIVAQTAQQVYGSAVRTVGSEISSTISSSIRDAFR
jgi:hypothetical protein